MYVAGGTPPSAGWGSRSHWPSHLPAWKWQGAAPSWPPNSAELRQKTIQNVEQIGVANDRLSRHAKVISHAANAIALAVQIACNGREIGVELTTHLPVQERRAILGAEHHVDQHE